MSQTECSECHQPLTRVARGEAVIVRLDRQNHANRRSHALCAQLRDHLMRHYKGQPMDEQTSVEAYERLAPLIAAQTPPNAHFLSAKWLYERIVSRPTS